MSKFSGTGKLLKLAIRRDRLKLPLWVLCIGGFMMISVPSVLDVYATKDDQYAYALASAVSPVARAFNGPVTGASAGSVALAETFTFLSLFVALMATLMVIRHTRQNEETGRAELIGAAATGRLALTTAALLLAVIASCAVGGLTAVAYRLGDLPLEGSLLAGAAMAMVGVVFASIAAVAAQITQSARAANGIAASAIGVAFLLRAIGDMQGKVQASGLEVVSAWPTWLSPMGWARETRPFTDNHWWVLGLMAAVFIGFTGIAFILMARRDVGAGMIPGRRGRSTASIFLHGVFGLAWRLQRGLLMGWASAMVIFAISLGGVANEVDKITGSSEQASRLISQLGGSSYLIDAYMAFSINLMGIAIAGYMIQALLRLRSEETAGYGEALLVTAVPRPLWLLSHGSVALGGVLLLLLITGAGVGISYGLSVNDVSAQLPRMLEAALVQLPAILFFGGVTMAIFGLLPRLTAALPWVLFTLCMIVGMFGGLLNLPDWTQDLSPFAHIPSALTNDISWVPLVVLTTIAAALCLLGFAFFRRRDTIAA